MAEGFVVGFARSVHRRIFKHFGEWIDWHKRKYAAPSPRIIKNYVLLRNGIPAAKWVESGTFLGDTTALLALHSTEVYSIEPSENLYKSAAKRFSKFINVNVIHGTSESVFPHLLPTLTGPINFWLDGHFSAGPTYKGDSDTPVVQELTSIAKNLYRLSEVCVLVDDVRCFASSSEEPSSYPQLNFLVNWANENGLLWHIEHDIFIAKSPSDTDRSSDSSRAFAARRAVESP